MKYKAEVLHNFRVIGSFYYSNLSQPNQAVRNVVERMKNKVSCFLVVVVNDIGEVWKYSVMKKPDGKLYVRKMAKSDTILNRDELDMIFTGNRTIV